MNFAMEFRTISTLGREIAGVRVVASGDLPIRNRLKNGSGKLLVAGRQDETLIGKAHDLHKKCGYEVLLALKKGHHSYIYTSYHRRSLTSSNSVHAN